MPDLDARILRLEQGVVTVVLLTGFVFQIPWMIPAAALLAGLDAVLGRAGPTAAVWRAAFAPRLKPPTTFDARTAVRAQQLCAFGALILATLLQLAGLGTIATILAILVAGITAFAATGLFCLGAELDRRNRPRRRDQP